MFHHPPAIPDVVNTRPPRTASSDLANIAILLCFPASLDCLGAHIWRHTRERQCRTGQTALGYRIACFQPHTVHEESISGAQVPSMGHCNIIARDAGLSKNSSSYFRDSVYNDVITLAVKGVE